MSACTWCGCPGALVGIVLCRCVARGCAKFDPAERQRLEAAGYTAPTFNGDPLSRVLWAVYEREKGTG